MITQRVRDTWNLLSIKNVLFAFSFQKGVQPIFKSITKTPIRVSKYKLYDEPEHDEITKYNYIEDGHVFETEGATIK